MSLFYLDAYPSYKIKVVHSRTDHDAVSLEAIDAMWALGEFDGGGASLPP